MKIYELADCITKSEHTDVKSVATITKQQYEEICNCFSFVDFYHTCKCLRSMVVENGNTLQNYILSLKTKKRSYTDSELEDLVIKANGMLVDFLSSIKMSVDIFSNLISKKDKKLYDEFVKLNSQLYDENFGYRFLTRMRNYVMHRNMPFKKITNSIEDGITIRCIKNILLEFDGWSTVKEEINLMPDCISIEKYVPEAIGCFGDLYIKAIEVISKDVVEGNIKINDICKQYNIKSPTILVMEENSKSFRIHDLPLYMMNEFLLEASRYPSLGINVMF